MHFELPSFAKINWTLEILGRRADGYHELRTILQTVDVRDQLSFAATESGIVLTCDNAEVPCDETNLVYRAAMLLRELTDCDKGAKIDLQKRIPMGAGLGGGSSNAAITLLALLQLWELEVAPRDLFQLGSQLGSDVPFFFLGGTGIGIGRGDEVYPMADVAAEHLLLVNPGVHVPTREIYGNLPSELTRSPALNNMPFSLEAAYARMHGAQWQLHNDLERPALALYPLIGQVKQRLSELNATAVLMSGSGATVFAVFESEAARTQARQELSETGWWCATTRTLNRNEYQAAITVKSEVGSRKSE
ncbi:MAG TPA: 4-(cytidine 5'-diphospho)-2-C-methyl-D-erythritol kinase [Blastocatellia bacterium]|nr:4-(cytidine 5'-diphospho)-2-C-methyl-D-erythritol kinase [Blastocatellia bacterium]